ncbi:hypothetical protein [uncultured Proteiniphilum sp.]|uniref:hypothetical protein n=1 Tax=uncultured Proteiniphilum sp. TaxID=497637 RepID=UPI00261AB2B9|nr:hypothetical protein [uncultured Proteiniphilum sp.]
MLSNYYEGWDSIVRQDTQDEHYPLGLFALKLRQIEFDDITIFYGDNAPYSHKSTEKAGATKNLNNVYAVRTFFRKRSDAHG